MDPSPPQKKMFCYNLTLKKRTYLKFYEHSLPKSFMPAFFHFRSVQHPLPIIGMQIITGERGGENQK